MTTEIDPDLVANLTSYANRGVKFEAAKIALLNAGYLDAEIEAAGREMTFTQLEAVSVDRPVDFDTQAALALSNDKADDEERKLREETTLAAMPNVSPTFALKFYDNLGLSYWKIGGLAVLIAGVGMYFRLPVYMISIALSGISGYVFIVFIRRFWWPRKRK